MESLLLTAHYFFCAFLIITILLQAGKGADIGAVFGGGSQTVFGSRGPATFLNKLTVIVAFAFLVTSIWLAHISKARTVTTVMDKVKLPAAVEKTVTPATEEQAKPATEDAEKQAKPEAKEETKAPEKKE